MSIYKSTLSYIHLLFLKQIHSFWHTHPRCGLWLSQLSGGVLWSIGVGGFCFLLLCQVPSQRLLISVNLSCATTFSFLLLLSLSPISLTFPLSLSTSPSSPYLTYSHCIYCWIPFLKAAADHSCFVRYRSVCLSLQWISSLIQAAELPEALHSRCEISLSHLQHRQQVCFYGTLMTMSGETFRQKEEVAKLFRSLDQQKGWKESWFVTQHAAS